MKLRGTTTFCILAPLSILAGYMLAPSLIDIKTDDSKTDKQIRKVTRTQKPTVETPKVVEPDPVVDDTPTKVDPIDTVAVVEPDPKPAVDDTVDVDPDSFVDGTDTETDEEVARRLAHFQQEKKDTGITLVSEVAYESELTSANWRAPEALKRVLAGRIRSRLKNLEVETMEEFIKEPANRLMLAQWQLLNSGDIKAIAKILGNAQNAQSLTPMLNDLSWMTGFVYDGALKKPDVALDMICQFRKIDPNMDIINITEERGEMLRDAHIKRRIAGCVAAEFSNNGWYGGETQVLTPEEIKEYQTVLGTPLPSSSSRRADRDDIYRLARERYLLFAEGVNKRLLNSSFYSIPTWLMRFCCGWKGDGRFGTATTMRWQRDNCSAPAASYKAMGGGSVPYLPTNIYGDSIFSKYYYEPFDVLYPNNFTKMVRDTGGVCGNISHYGATSANSNGIPAFSMGEPGHCAYSVYVDGVWHPCFSIYPDRKPHWKFWNENTWDALQLYTQMYHDGQRTRDAQLVASLGALLTMYRNPINGLKAYEMSLSMQPLNRGTWYEYIETAIKTLHGNPRRWLVVNKFLCTSMTPTSASGSADFLQSFIYPTMLKVLKAYSQKLEAYKDYYDSLKVQETVEWDMESLLNMQHEAMGSSTTQRMAHFSMVVEAVCRVPDFGPALTWAIITAYNENRFLGEKVMKDVDKFRETSPNKVLVDAAIIRAAEELRNAEMFAHYSKPYLDNKEKMPEFEKPKGNLISDKGTLYLSSYNEDLETIVKHASALTENGGLISSVAKNGEYVILTLPQVQRLGGIVIVLNNGAGRKYQTWYLSISKDGKTWDELALLPEQTSNESVSLIINKQHPTAKYIRVDVEKSGGIQFKALLVYDNKSKSSS